MKSPPSALKIYLRHWRNLAFLSVCVSVGEGPSVDSQPRNIASSWIGMTARICAFNFAVQFCTFERKFKGTVPREFQFQVFSWISFPKPMNILNILNISKIWGNIHCSRCTTGAVDTGGKFTTAVDDTGGNMLPVSTTPVANLPPVWLTTVANLQRWACKCFFKSANLKSANSWAQFAIKIRKFLKYVSSKISNPQIFHHKS